MAFSKLQLERIEEAIATGTLEVRFGDKTVKYQSTTELIKARDLIKDQLDCNPCTRGSVAAFYKE